MMMSSGSVYPPDSFVVVSHVLLAKKISVLGLSACSSLNGMLSFVAVTDAAACQPPDIRRVPANSMLLKVCWPTAGTICVAAKLIPLRLAGYSQ